jgi:hypothetical protein
MVRMGLSMAKGIGVAEELLGLIAGLQVPLVTPHLLHFT